MSRDRVDDASVTAGQQTRRVVPFTAGDGLRCNVVNVRSEGTPHKGPVILVHGAGMRDAMYSSIPGTTLVDVLLEDGYDVWLENWRASSDVEPNPWTLDKAAVYDHPEAVKTVVRETGSDEVSAVVHCMGSSSFVLSAAAGLLPEVKTVVSNACSLHPTVPRLARLKGKFALPVLSRLTDYADPSWGLHAPTAFAKALALYTRVTHRECDNRVCKLASFIYGVGSPTLWRHENLDEATHEWLKHEFGPAPVTFFKQMSRSAEAGRLVTVDGFRELPENPVAQEPQSDARFAFLAGQRNDCFVPSGQARTFEFFDSYRRGYHALHVLPGYGHLDVFVGKNAARDTFPLVLAELGRAPVSRGRWASAIS